MWSFQLAVLLFMLCRIFLSSLTLCNTSSFYLRSVQLIFSILLQHHISNLSTYFWSTYKHGVMKINDILKFQTSQFSFEYPTCSCLICPTIFSHTEHVILLDLIVLIRPLARGVEVGALQPLQIWLHPLGICKISKTNMLMRSELRKNNIKKPIHDSCDWQRARAVNNNHVIDSHLKNLVSF